MFYRIIFGCFRNLVQRIRSPEKYFNPFCSINSPYSFKHTYIHFVCLQMSSQCEHTIPSLICVTSVLLEVLNILHYINSFVHQYTITPCYHELEFEPVPTIEFSSTEVQRRLSSLTSPLQ